MPTAIKVIVQGQSCHGGSFDWRSGGHLPTQQPDGTWVPGQPTPPVSSPVLCRSGYHLVPLDPPQAIHSWIKPGCEILLAEYDGEPVIRADHPDKLAVSSCRILRPLTDAELERHQIFRSGSHEVRDGKAVAWGSATVEASDSATVRAWGSATVRAWGSATVRASDSATVRAWGSATVEASDSATVEASDSATVEASDSATVRAWGSATVRAWGSATVEASDSARCHATGQATATAWSGTTVVLTRDERAVMIDRRGPGDPVVYQKRRGIDGWRCTVGADGKPVWTQRAARTVAKAGA